MSFTDEAIECLEAGCSALTNHKSGFCHEHRQKTCGFRGCEKPLSKFKRLPYCDEHKGVVRRRRAEMEGAV